MAERTKKSEFKKRNNVDIIDRIFSEIEKDIQQDISYSTNRKDDFCIAIQQIFIQEKAYRDPDLTRDSLMKRMNIGKDVFVKRFQYCFDMSFRECVNILRLKEAVILLEQSDLSIEEIAIKAGFGTIRTFQRQFHAKYNMSPNEYRKTESNENQTNYIYSINDCSSSL